jgi:hypothetical protein
MFDRDWGIWRDKAKADFNISEEFFDLVSLDGLQRYLQVASYIKLSPISLARMHEGEIEGVYEPCAGYIKADKRRDEKVLVYFVSLKEDVQITIYNLPLLDGKTNVL